MTVNDIADACAAAGSARELQLGVIAALRPAVPFDAYAFVLTDPATAVGASPLAEVPDLGRLPELIGCRYATVVNRWTALTSPATLPPGDTPWRQMLRGYGIEDVLSAAYRDAYGLWAFLDLWRRDGRFTATELATVGATRRAVTAGLRRCYASSLRVPRRGVPKPGPLVVTLDDRLHVLGQTSYATEVLAGLLPPDDGRSTVPAAAYNVAAQLLAAESGVDTNPPVTRVWLTAGVWLTLRAARLGTAAIAVTFEETTGADRLDLYARTIGLTARERELVANLSNGADTRAVAHTMGVSANTVQDHLKSIFGKAGIHSRRELLAVVV